MKKLTNKEELDKITELEALIEATCQQVIAEEESATDVAISWAIFYEKTKSILDEAKDKIYKKTQS